MTQRKPYPRLPQTGGEPREVARAINHILSMLNPYSIGAVAVASGFLDRSETTISFTDGTRTLALTPVGEAFSYWQNGQLYTQDAAMSIAIADTEGLHYVYLEGEEMKVTTTFTTDLITLYALVAVIYWDATNNAGILVGDERHTSSMGAVDHLYHHLTVGTRYESGLGLGNMSVDGTGATADAQFSVADGAIWDEDIRHAIADDDPQDLSTVAEIPLYYRSGASGVWRRVAATSFPVTTTGSGRVAWNQLTGGSWQLTEAANAQYVLMHYFATNDIVAPVIGIVGQSTYATKTAAQNGALSEMQSLSLGVLQTLLTEYSPLATVIWQTNDGYANTVNARIVSTADGADYVDWRRQRAIPGGGTAALGSAAYVDVGTAEGQVPQMDATGYPPADGSQITDLQGPGIAAFSVSFDTSGAVAASFNVTDVTKNSTGNFTINLSITMPDSDYAVHIDTDQSSATPRHGHVIGRGTTTVNIAIVDNGGTAVDSNIDAIMVTGMRME